MTVRIWTHYIIILVFVSISLTNCKKNEESKEPVSNDTVTDIDGNVYKTVTIGTQVWMAENLRTSKYRNGAPIPYVVNDADWSKLQTGAQCNYNNDETIVNKYGKLYNWHAVNDSRNIAPVGWHIPTNNEWTTLEFYVAGQIGTSGSVAKALASKTDWNTSSVVNSVGNNLVENDTTGFTAFPSGFRVKSGTFNYFGKYAGWWSSTEFEYIKDSVWNRSLNFEYSILWKNIYYFKETGFSVRCIKD